MIKLNKIVAYNSINDIERYYEENSCDLIISAYKDSVDSIKNNNKKINIISMGEIISELFNFWNDKELEYENIINLRRFLTEEKYINIVNKFDKSIDSIYSDIKTCKELNIYPEEYEQFIETDEDVIFLNLMRKIYMENNFIDYDIKLHNYKKDIELFKCDFVELINNKLGTTVDLNKNCKKIIIQGFYYITPTQRVIIDLISKSGIEIIPLICFNPEYDEVNKIIYKTFNNAPNIYNEYEKSHIKKDISDIFGDILGNRKIDCYKAEVEHNIEFNIYDDLNAYNKDILNCDKYIYATSKSNLINRISIFGGNLKRSKKISIKYYSIGIFLKDIYKTWNKNRKDIMIDIDVLYRIFETGILKIHNRSSKEYLYDLMIISNYYIDCKTLKEWIERSSMLKENIVNCRYDVFKKHYAPFTINLSRLQDIIEYLNQIKSITDILFNEDDYEVDMGMHLKNLMYIVEKNIYDTEDKDNLMAYELLKKIKAILKHRESKIRVNNTYLHDAINRYINTIQDEGESELNIFTLDSVESSYSSSENQILICDFDRDNFPKIKKLDTPWLSSNKLKNIMGYKNSELEKDLIYRHLILREDKDLISRYVFWLMLKIPKYKIISRVNNKDRDTEHFYESILCEVGVKRNYKQFNEKKNSSLESIDLSKYILDKDKQRDLKKEGNNQLFKYCPLRAFLYRINLNNECYTDNFRIEHYMSTLVAAIVLKEESLDRRKSEIIKLLDLLPQYPKVVKNTIMAASIKKCIINDKITNLDAYIHDTVDVETQFKNLKHNIKNNERIHEREVIKHIYSKTIPKSNSNEYTCKFCPNIDKCIEKNPPQINY
ncbi:hypothetical protein WS9_004510 [Paraclostridium sordellii 8483]|uniref:hypothetical protein n=1 Tax=Paraclostridium sordellii TaxID=1505 RepID=UPI000658E023|nr:hypothetical protein [Paeniclostridium sordellii]TAN68886.1 hypothetical protein WS9_004510 [Paeniclostridium sordellii 8483]